MRLATLLTLVSLLFPVLASAERQLDEDEYREIQRLHSRIQRYTPKNVKLPATSTTVKTDEGVTSIGLTVGSLKRRFVVTHVLPLSPAEKAGIKIGDELVEVDGKRLYRTMSIMIVADKISGRGATAPLTLKIGRTSGGFRTVTIARNSRAIVPELTLERRGDASYIRMVRFGDETKRQIVEMVGEAARASTGGIIIDLRSTEGGSIEAAGAFVAAFVKKGTHYATVSNARGSRKLVTTQEPAVKKEIPVVVIINALTALPAEVALTALQEYGRVRLVGTKTSGAGMLTLDDGATYNPLTHQVLSPNDRVLTKVGIAPHYTVKEKNDEDAPLALAIKVLHAPRGELEQ